MKKSIYYFLTLLISLFSCEQKTVSEKQTDSKPKLDTIKLGNFEFTVSQIPKSKFKTKKQTENEEVLLHKDLNVDRRSDSLIFTLQNNQKYILKNDTSDSEEYANYTFAGTLENSNFWVVEAAYWEWYNTILINKITGDTVITIGNPTISKNKKYVICGNADLVAGFTFNGIELYNIESPKPKFLGNFETENWGPIEFNWINKNTILVCQERVNSNLQTYQTYAKMKIK